MEATLLIRLEGPMQSWGTQSRFSHRDTGHEPSKSGVIGLLCAALGKPREERPEDGFPTLERLNSLSMGVRVDREGRIFRDYHTAQNILKSDAKNPDSPKKGDLKKTELSNRYYIADASFLVGLRGPVQLLENLDAALLDPRWPLFLGRKSFTPARPPTPPAFFKGAAWPALQDSPLFEALKRAPWMKPKRFAPERLRLTLDDPQGAEVRQDVPLSFELGFRRGYAARRTRTDFVSVSDLPHIIEPEQEERS